MLKIDHLKKVRSRKTIERIPDEISILKVYGDVNRDISEVTLIKDMTIAIYLMFCFFFCNGNFLDSKTQ